MKVAAVQIAPVYLDSQRTYYSIMTDYQNSLFAWNMDKASLEKAIGEDIQ